MKLSRVVLAAAIIAAACSSRQDTRERLTFWGLGAEGEQVAQLIPEFERRNPGIHVVVQQIPWTAAHEKLLTAYVGESTPDVAQMGNTWIPEFVAMNALADVGNVVDRSDYFPGIWATNVVGDTTYGVPWYVDTRVLFYRSDILAAVGYPHGPRTWDEWRDAMTKIRDQHRSRFAILLPTNEWEPIVMLALSNSSTLLDPAGTRGAFRQPPFAEAFTFYVDTFRAGFAPAVSNSQIANLYQQFAQGDFAMYITGPWNVGEFHKRLPANMQDKWATAPLPARHAGEPCGISMAGGSSLVMFKDAKHRAAAEKLIRFLSEPAQQARFFELTGDLPARRSAWNAPAIAKESRFPAFREQLERVAPLPKVPEWEQIASSIFDRGEAAVRGAVPIPKALAALDQRADELLEKRRWLRARPAALVGPAFTDARSILRTVSEGAPPTCHPERSEGPHDGSGSARGAPATVMGGRSGRARRARPAALVGPAFTPTRSILRTVSEAPHNSSSVSVNATPTCHPERSEGPLDGSRSAHGASRTSMGGRSGEKPSKRRTVTTADQREKTRGLHAR